MNVTSSQTYLGSHFKPTVQYVDCMKIYVNAANNWTIMNYNKEQLTDSNVLTLGLFRSVIFNTEKKMVCFSPPKSVTYDQVFHPENDVKLDYEYEEHIEGTMINLFWCEQWEISTKCVIGGNNGVNINGNVTFRKMFDDMFRQSNISYDDLNKEYSYSFVLQHINNPIVSPVSKSRLVLIAIYRIENKENPSEILVHTIDKREYHHQFLNNSNIELPTQYSYEEYYTKFDQLINNQCIYSFVGISVYNKKTYRRCKIVNPSYQYYKQLRGNDYNQMHRFMRNYKNNSIHPYLICFPNDIFIFDKYNDCMNKLYKSMYDLYCKHYIKKEKLANDCPNSLKKYLSQIHYNYYTFLKPHHQRVTLEYIKQFIHYLDVKLTCDLLLTQI